MSATIGQAVWELLVRYVAHSIYELPLIAAAAWLAARMLRKVGAHAQHCIWLLALELSVILPTIPAHSLTWLRWPSTTREAGTTVATFISYGRDTSSHLLTASSAAAAALTLFYLATVLLGSGRLLWRWQRTRVLVLRSNACPLGEAAERLVTQGARRLGIAEPMVRFSADVAGPVTLGLRQPLLIVPEGFFDLESEDDIAAALAHECAHIRRGDFARNLFYECIAVAVAYHPAVWLIRRRIAETRELACDEMAAGSTSDRNRYAASLLRLATAMAERTPAASVNAIGVFDANILEERIMRLTTAQPNMSRAKKIAMTAVAMGLLLGGGMTALAMGFDVNAQSKEKIYKVGDDVSAPKLIYSVDALFPPSQRKKGKLDGVSVIGLSVNSQGLPQDLHAEPLTASLSRMLSKANPNKKFQLSPDFDKNAIDAVRQYRFKPAMREGKPVATSITIVVNFHRS